jgi:hypothetical protein
LYMLSTTIYPADCFIFLEHYYLLLVDSYWME